MLSRRSTQRILQQQQPRRDSDIQQQQAGTQDFQQQQSGSSDGKPEQMGEGSYEGTRQFQKRIGEYLDKADVDADAEAAKPRSEQEARDLEKAEEEGKSHSKGER